MRFTALRLSLLLLLSAFAPARPAFRQALHPPRSIGRRLPPPKSFALTLSAAHVEQDPLPSPYASDEELQLVSPEAAPSEAAENADAQQPIPVFVVPRFSQSPHETPEESPEHLDDLQPSWAPEQTSAAEDINGDDDEDPALVTLTVVTVAPTVTASQIFVSEGKPLEEAASLTFIDLEPKPSPGASQASQPTVNPPVFEITVNPSVTPWLAYSPSPDEQVLSIDEQVIEQAPSMSPQLPEDDDIWVEIPMSVSSTEEIFSPTTDASIRTFAANATNSSQDDWKLVVLSKSSASGSVRQIKQSTSFLTVYQGLLPRQDVGERVLTLQEGVAEGDLDSFLQGTLGDEAMTVDISGPPRFDVDAVEEIVAENSQIVSGTENGSESATTSGEVEQGQNEKGSEPKSTGNGKKFGIILGSCLSGIALLVVALALFVRYRNRDEKQDHMIDGVAGVPTTITSLDNSESDSNSSRYETGAPVHPRGPSMLRNQSRILDWQLNQPDRVEFGQGNSTFSKA